MRRAAKIDGNHHAVVKALRQIGVTVQSLAVVGEGCPDLLCGYHGRNCVLEVKDGSLVPSKRALTADEKIWHAKWGGQAAVVNSPEEAMVAVIRHCVSP